MDYLSVTDTCAALHVSPRTLNRLITSGELTATKTGRRHNSPIKVRVDSIRAYIERHTVLGTEW